MTRKDFLTEYEAIAQLTGAGICVYETGFHPALVSIAEQAAAVSKFLDDERKNRNLT